MIPQWFVACVIPIPADACAGSHGVHVDNNDRVHVRPHLTVAIQAWQIKKDPMIVRDKAGWKMKITKR